MPTIVRLPLPPTDAGDPTILDGWKVVAGSPTMRTWVQQVNSDGTLASGYWEATPGTYHASYSAWEFVHMIAGRIVITPDGGAPVTVQAGDAFVVEAEFRGTWEIIEPVRKHFAARVK